MSGCANAPEYYVIHTVPSLLCATCCVGLAIVLCWTGNCVTLKLFFFLILFLWQNFPLTSRNSYCLESVEDDIPFGTQVLSLLVPLFYWPCSRLYKHPRIFSREERTESKCEVAGSNSGVLKDGSALGCGNLSAPAAGRQRSAF
jgi:hypothetical protein